ncbi:hypothetical protein BD410DRAFT_730308 [Rickenella mellea]|uniref:N-acetyltransferase domain-containing protein n=1 Tax=Rickenella mellea TaxID=50990 RepID=A0A4Y7PQ47_9AGAM|nr:hypothetical protein BD410DRAFT_730308 [Rickenella mellea]
MAEPPNASIRAYDKEEDDKVVRFMIGKSQMEPLAVANLRGTMSPVVLSVWFALSAVIIQFMGWWPSGGHGVWGYLTPLPPLAASAVPVMFFIDWLNRPYFEEQTRIVLARPDMVDARSYYTRSPASGLWLLDFGPKFVGLIALDASLDAQSDETFLDRPRAGKVKWSKGTNKVASIRHFFVEEVYRPSLVQDDLLKHALEQAFNANNNVQKVKASASPLTPYIGRSLRDAGFKNVGKGPKAGVLAWRNVHYELTREQWTASKPSEL